MTSLDARSYLSDWLSGLAHMYIKDINALPEDKWTASHGGCTRSAQAVTADTIALLEWTTLAMEGNISDVYDESTINAVATGCATPAEAVTRMQTACERFSTALKAASDETLSEVITPPWKMPTALFMLAHVAVSHVWYHDGQINYMQALLGDEKVHWMD